MRISDIHYPRLQGVYFTDTDSYYISASALRERSYTQTSPGTDPGNNQ